MTFEQHIDDVRRRVTLTFVGDVRGRTFLNGFTAMILRRPELVLFDYYFDMLRYVGDIGPADVAPLAEMFVALAPAQGLSGRSAFATKDPHFDCWAAAFDHQFPGRIHRVFPTAEAAKAWLAEAPELKAAS